MLQYVVGTFLEAGDVNPPTPFLLCLSEEVFEGFSGSSRPPIPSLAWLKEVKEIFFSVDEKLVSKVKESKNVALVFLTQCRWYSVAVNASTGKAVPMNDSFARLLSA